MARCEAQGAGFIGSLNITANQLEGTTGNGAFMRDLRQLGIVTKWNGQKYGNVQQRFYLHTCSHLYFPVMFFACLVDIDLETQPKC